MPQQDEYFLGYRQTEQQRLQQQAELLARDSTWLFDQIGLSVGAHVVEFGCGPQGCLGLLAARVGPAGRVIGIERSPDAVALARKFVADSQLANVEILLGDARAPGLMPATFDLVTARLVLVNVPRPEEIVAAAVALVRPGGWVAFHEVDWAACLCDPPSPAWDDLIDLMHKYAALNGIDLLVGRKLPGLLRAAGLIDVQVNPLIHAYPLGHPRRNVMLDFAHNLSERFLAQKLITEQALADLKHALARHLNQPETLVLIGPYIQAWGRQAT
jgi:SAM-dependent methyltransferase